MRRYAEATEVPSDRSRSEIERTLQRYGATSFAYGWQQGSAVIVFEARDRRIRFTLPMPDRTGKEFTRTATGKPRSTTAAADAYEQAVRQRWRALALAIKAKLEAVECKISTFEEEFLAHVVLPDGSTVGQWIAPQLDDVYRSRTMPPMLALGGPTAKGG